LIQYKMGDLGIGFNAMGKDIMTNKKNSKSSSLPETSNQLSTDAYNDIRKMIFLDEFRPGQQVSARGLSERQKMSLTPVVQALKIFEHMGIVSHEANRGFFVEKISAQEVEEVYRLRELIELSLLPDMIRNLDEKGEKLIEQALEEYFEAARNKPIKFRLIKDINFHMTMAKLSGQNISVWILRYLYDLLYLRFDKGLISYRPNDISGREHQAIFDAVISRDIEASKKVLRMHIRTICKGTLKSMNEIAMEMEDIDF